MQQQQQSTCRHMPVIADSPCRQEPVLPWSIVPVACTLWFLAEPVMCAQTLLSTAAAHLQGPLPQGGMEATKTEEPPRPSHSLMLPLPCPVTRTQSPCTPSGLCRLQHPPAARGRRSGPLEALLGWPMGKAAMVRMAPARPGRSCSARQG